jgi:IS5 family transposase
MKGHIGVDSKEKIIHPAEDTPANVHDSQTITELLHGSETKVWGDSAYQGQKGTITKVSPNARDMTNKRDAL